MDSLRADDIERARATPPAEKLAQALELMRMGIAMKRAKLRADDPEAPDAVIEDRLLAWLAEPR
jgi:Rv0078B-related antitoxin